MLATLPWTYWMVFPLFATVVVALVAVLVGSYRKILVPTYEWWVEQLSADQAEGRRPALRLVAGATSAENERAQLRRAA